MDTSEWVEVKMDGFRALASIEDRAARIMSRRLHLYKSFPEVCETLAAPQ